MNAGTRSVLRRYETYAYTGAYDPLTHEVICGGDATCNIPQPGELGDLLVAQMVAANVAVPSLTVVVTGNGTVASSDKVISCGSKCCIDIRPRHRGHAHGQSRQQLRPSPAGPAPVPARPLPAT